MKYKNTVTGSIDRLKNKGHAGKFRISFKKYKNNKEEKVTVDGLLKKCEDENNKFVTKSIPVVDNNTHFNTK